MQSQIKQKEKEYNDIKSEKENGQEENDEKIKKLIRDFLD